MFCLRAVRENWRYVNHKDTMKASGSGSGGGFGVQGGEVDGWIVLLPEITIS